MNRLCTEQNKMAINNTLGVWVGDERALVNYSFSIYNIFATEAMIL